MRMLFSGLVAAGLLASQTAGAICLPAADREALDVAGLKTQLMVITLTCKTDSQYNAFINRFKPELVSEERLAHNYFSHAYGRAGQKRQDEYMTQLAESKSQAGLLQGNRFCDRNQNVFDEVLALKNNDELKQYAAGRATGTPETLSSSCNESPARVTRTASHSRSSSRKRS